MHKDSKVNPEPFTILPEKTTSFLSGRSNQTRPQASHHLAEHLSLKQPESIKSPERPTLKWQETSKSRSGRPPLKRQDTSLKSSFPPSINESAVTTNWHVAAISLLLLCTIMLTMVILIGHKDNICSVCKIQWVQRGEHCFLFSSRSMGWHSSMGYCKEVSSTLAVVSTKEEMDFLMQETKKHFDLRYRQYQYHKFWISLKYDSDSKWRGANGTPYHLNWDAKLAPWACAYLQNGEFYSQNCQEEAFFICETEVQFGWS
ncbi:early activation antigen CD69-like isoform X2 [Hemicordylus capensis]|uniref:early activation antigen CD69-like isoform X2 n=1 Tax=Hemicordylus capensis TaxID=884348 RepID=UPI00230315AB|nr:early activation antigen CD69-like isoform X2 [Hemicordylus capensis]